MFHCQQHDMVWRDCNLPVSLLQVNFHVYMYAALFNIRLHNKCFCNISVKTVTNEQMVMFC